MRAGFTGEHDIRSYLVGEVHADWLDEEEDLRSSPICRACRAIYPQRVEFPKEDGSWTQELQEAQTMSSWPGNARVQGTTFGSLSRSDLMSKIRSRGNRTTEERLTKFLRLSKIRGWRRRQVW